MKLTWSPLVGRGSGKAGDGVLTVWKGIQVLRQRVVPKNPKSALQTTQRGYLARMAYYWRSLPANVQAFLNVIAAERGRMSGYNVYCKEDLQHLADGEELEVCPDNLHVIHVTSITATPGVTELTITWVAGNAVATNKVTILYADETADDNVWHLDTTDTILVSAGTHDITGLTAAHVYRVALLVEGGETPEIFSGGRGDQGTPT